MNKDQYELFKVLNDIILFSFERLTPWEKNFVSDLHHKSIARQPISNKQEQLVLQILMKVNRLKR
jgi:hypothetical protein